MRKLLKKSGTQKPNSKKKIIESLDKEFSKYIRSIGHCEKCLRGKSTKLETAHFLTRANLSIRWDKDNAVCLCQECHRWAHKNRELFRLFFSSIKHPDELERVEKLANQKAEPASIFLMKTLLKIIRLVNSTSGRKYEVTTEY